MATTKRKQRKDGSEYYEIRCHVSRDRPTLTMRWNVPEGWSQKAIDRELQRVASDFERKAREGEELSLQERKAKEAKEAAEAAAELAKLKTFRQYSEIIYMGKKLLTLSENGRQSYKMYFDNHINPVLGDCLIRDITPAMVDALITDYQKTHAHASTIKLWNILNGVFKMAAKDDSIAINPLTKLERPEPKADETPKEESEKFYNVQELQYILDCLKNVPLKWQVYIRLMTDTGLRRGECTGIQWSDVNFKKNEITIRHNLQRSKEKGIYDKKPKNKRVRVVDVDPDIIALMKTYQTEQSEKHLSKYVFSQEYSDKPMSPDTPTKFFKSLEKRYGIKDFHPHKLRHSNISVALKEGADIPSVSQRAGHSNPAVTMRIYAHTDQEAVRQAGQKARDALKKDSGKDEKQA